ncbi:MAG: hypothetical protein KDI44_07360 [Thiothrix sp.]|nr:hypothetical protein [Thiothrix sp.]HPQ94447.1 hypothetical protein [Thiolinea sp.]
MRSPVPACITVLLPGLFDALALWRQDFSFTARAPCLARLLGAARPVPEPAGYETVLLNAFGLDAARFSWAMARYRLDTGVADAPALLCADPVCLESGVDRIVLHPEPPPLSIPETGALLTDLNRHLAMDGWQLEAPVPQHWYLRPQPDTASAPLPAWPRTVSPLIPGSASIQPFLPGGPERWWRRMLTELQMLLHQHPVNRVREREGLLPVNSLWLWGLNDPDYVPVRSGRLVAPPPFQQVAGGGFRGRILAAMAGIPWHESIGDGELEALCRERADVLLICPGLLPPLWHDAPEDWQQVLQQLDAGLFRVLAQQHQAGFCRVILHDGSGRAWHCGPVPFWQRWRRPAVFDFSRLPP